MKNKEEKKCISCGETTKEYTITSCCGSIVCDSCNYDEYSYTSMVMTDCKKCDKTIIVNSCENCIVIMSDCKHILLVHSTKDFLEYLKIYHIKDLDIEEYSKYDYQKCINKLIEKVGKEEFKKYIEEIKKDMEENRKLIIKYKSMKNYIPIYVLEEKKRLESLYSKLSK